MGLLKTDTPRLLRLWDKTYPDLDLRRVCISVTIERWRTEDFIIHHLSSLARHDQTAGITFQLSP